MLVGTFHSFKHHFNEIKPNTHVMIFYSTVILSSYFAIWMQKKRNPPVELIYVVDFVDLKPI